MALGQGPLNTTKFSFCTRAAAENLSFLGMCTGSMLAPTSNAVLSGQPPPEHGTPLPTPKRYSHQMTPPPPPHKPDLSATTTLSLEDLFSSMPWWFGASDAPPPLPFPSAGTVQGRVGAGGGAVHGGGRVPGALGEPKLAPLFEGPWGQCQPQELTSKAGSPPSITLTLTAPPPPRITLTLTAPPPPPLHHFDSLCRPLPPPCMGRSGRPKATEAWSIPQHQGRPVFSQVLTDSIQAQQECKKGRAFTKTLVYRLDNETSVTAHGDCSGGPSFKDHWAIRAEGWATRVPLPPHLCVQMPKAWRSDPIQVPVRISVAALVQGHSTRNLSHCTA